MRDKPSLVIQVSSPESDDKHTETRVVKVGVTDENKVQQSLDTLRERQRQRERDKRTEKRTKTGTESGAGLVVGKSKETESSESERDFDQKRMEILKRRDKVAEGKRQRRHSRLEVLKRPKLRM